MTEEVDNNDVVSLDKETRKVRVLLDPTPTVVSKDQEIAKLNQELGKMQEINKALLAQDAERERIKAIRKNEPAPPPIGGETATLETPEPFKIPYDEESQVLDMNPKFENPKACIDYIKNCASNPRSGDYLLAKKLYGKMVKKVLKQGGTFEFKGNMCRWERRGDKVVKANRPQTFEQIRNED